MQQKPTCWISLPFLLYVVVGTRFDDAARQFISLERSYNNILQTSSDVKEVIPEFFYLPEMFVNVNSGWRVPSWGMDSGRSNTLTPFPDSHSLHY